MEQGLPARRAASRRTQTAALLAVAALLSLVLVLALVQWVGHAA